MNDTMTPGTTSQTPPPPPPTGRPPLRRRLDDRMIAGVASGAARTLGIEVAVVRILFVVALFVGGLGIPFYLAGWLLIPEEGSDDALVSGVVKSRGAQFWIGVVLLVIGVLALADQFSVVTGDLAWPLVLIGIGIVLWRSSRDDDHQSPPSSAMGGEPGSAMPPSSTAGDGPSAGQDATSAASPADTATAVMPATDPGAGGPPPPTSPVPGRAEASPPARSRRRDRSILGRVTVALALIAVGVLWLGDQADLLDLTFRDAVATALGITGIGLLVGAWLGRARWLIAVGIILIPVLMVSATLRTAGVDLSSGAGERVYVPGAVSELPEAYELAAGQMVLDLTELELGDDPVEIEARIGAGQLEVIVPDDAALEVDADVGMGEIRVLGEGPSGAGLDHSFGRSGERGPIVLDLDVSLGEIVVNSRPAPDSDN